jgi:hypothetical protein
MCKYIKEYYGMPADINRRVTIDGKPGIIVKDMGTYIGVNFDDKKNTSILPCHPTWKVEYLEMGTPRGLTRSQKRYQHYLEIADCVNGFGDFLRCYGHRY